MSHTLPVVIRAVTLEGIGILSFELRPVTGEVLPSFTAGSHIDVHLPSGIVRSYSLLNSQEEQHRYVIAVQLDPNSRGGSRAAHELRVGQQLTISAPRNNFALSETAGHSVLIAGGIGITPLWSMLQRLQFLGRSWDLFYSARTRAHAAFLEALEALQPASRERVYLNFDQEPGGRMLDLASLIAGQPPGTHFYCCGPKGMLDAFKGASSGLHPECVHLEYFAGTQEVAREGGFCVQLAKCGLELSVAPGQTILQAVLDAGVDVPYSCQDGVCGSCEVRVLSGVPDHRDLILSADEQERNNRMMICCSGSKSATLVLDL